MGVEDDQNLENTTAAANNLKSAIDKAKSPLLSIVDEMKNFVGGSNDFGTAMQGMAANTVKFTQSLKNVQGAGDLAGNMMAMMAMQGATLLKAINKQVDIVEKYRIELNRSGIEGSKTFILGMRKQQDALMDYGVTLDKLREASVTFRTELAMFTKTGLAANENALRKLAVVNERFGVGIGTSTTFINKLDQGFGMTGKAADKFSRRLLGFAKDTGQPFNKVFQDFNNSIGTFFVEMDSDKALKKFTVFQQIARRFGTEISTLTTLTDKFETIEGGMEFGGNLNMLLSNLGGSFDAVEATLMSQPERMEYIAEQIQGVAGQVEGMTDLGQRAILKELSTQLGVDVGVVRAMMDKDKGKDLDSFMKGTSDLSAMSDAKQKELADANTTRQEKQQQVSDAMVGKFAIAAERTAQAVTRFDVALEKKALTVAMDKLDKHAVPALNTIAAKFDEAAQILKGGGKNDLVAQMKQALGVMKPSKTHSDAISANTIALRESNRIAGVRIRLRGGKPPPPDAKKEMQ